jgi:2-polyprenyl-3-methyl-5-hydroxy-6-metoxy-1,4-benzoquinol methylase
MKLSKCVCCDGELELILDWGNMPLANNYNIKEAFPLRLNKCKSCCHLQLDEIVNPEILFKDYPYFSGTSKTSLDYFKEFAEMCLRSYPDAITVLDIACNDAAQLDAFKELGLMTHGIDPAENLLPVSSKKGHKVICGMFPNEKLENTDFDIITAQNVVAHTPDPLNFLKGCEKIMHNESFLFIATSQANMVNGTEYDTIYHEHISYFNTLSMKALVERAGLTLVDVFTNPIHGTSYIFVIKKNKIRNPVEVRIEKEGVDGLYEESTYLNWVNNCKNKAAHTKSIIEDYRSKGYAIIGCGAAAKGITFLNITKTQMDLIVDTTPAKWYNGVCNTTIYPFEYIRTLQDEKVLFVILAWNFEKEITQNVLKFRNNSNDIFMNTNQK